MDKTKKNCFIIHYYSEIEPDWYRGKTIGICGLTGRRSQDKNKVTCKRCLNKLEDSKNG